MYAIQCRITRKNGRGVDVLASMDREGRYLGPLFAAAAEWAQQNDDLIDDTHQSIKLEVEVVSFAVGLPVLPLVRVG